MNQGFPGSAKFLRALNFFCLAVLCLFVGISYSEDNKPDAMWYRAFLTYESSVELEKKGEYLEALNKCNEAKALYDGLAYNFPQFQPDIVKFKQKIVADTRLRIIDANKQRVLGGNVQRPPQGYPPSPLQSQQIPRDSELPNVELPQSYNGGGRGTTPIAPEPEVQTWGPGGSDVLPSWNYNPDVGRNSNDLLNEVRREEQRKDSIIQELNRENQKLKAERDANQARLQTVQDQLAASQKKQEEYRQRMESYERQPGNQNLAQKYKALLEETISALRDSTEQNAMLVSQLREARTTIQRQDDQIKQLVEERDSLAKIVQGKGIGSEALQDLMEQNKRLTERLDLAEKYALRASNDNKQREQDIALLKTEVEKVRVERDRLVVDNVKHQQQIEGLQKKLEMLSDGLSEDDRKGLASIGPEQRAENELLRSMVLKQLRRQAQLKQAKELLLRQLDRVGARSTALMEVVEDMARGTQLSPEEKALFRAPQFADLMEAAAPEGTENGKDNIVYDTLSAPAGLSDQNADHGQKVAVELSQLDKTARIDFQAGRFNDAEAGFLKYLHYRPKSVPCLCNLGILKIAVKNYDDAQQYLQKAIAIDNSSGLAFYLLGRTYFLQEKYDEALSQLEQGIQLEPNNAKAHNCVGVIASQKGWAARAEKAFCRAVDIDPKFGDAHFNLAVLFSSREQANFEKAREHYQKAIELGVPPNVSIEKYLKNTADSMKLPYNSKAAISLGLR